MAARRLLLVMVLLLIASSLAAALVPPPPERDQSSTSTTSTSTTGTEGSQATGEAGRNRLITQSVDAGGEEPALLSLKAGDQLALAVTSDRFVEVEIPALGLFDTATPGSPARFNLIADEPGRIGVRTLKPERVVAQITISEPTKPSEPRPPPADEQGPADPEAPPQNRSVPSGSDPNGTEQP